MTATCCSTSWRGEFPFWAWSRPRTLLKWRSLSEYPPWCSSSEPTTGGDIAEHRGRADLVVANNVFAHVPDIRDFAAGLRELVKDTGLVTLEFPHLLRLMRRRQFDTIYHEHYSYLSLLTASRALATAGLRVVDVEELDTHGGSLRVHSRPRGACG